MEAMDKIQEMIEVFARIDYVGLPYEKFSVNTQTVGAMTYSFEDRFTLYKDLFKYEKDFTSRRYRHNDLEKLVNLLYQIFRSNKELDRIPDKLNFDQVVRFREGYKKGDNKKKFFF